MYLYRRIPRFLDGGVIIKKAKVSSQKRWKKFHHFHKIKKNPTWAADETKTKRIWKSVVCLLLNLMEITGIITLATLYKIYVYHTWNVSSSYIKADIIYQTFFIIVFILFFCMFEWWKPEPELWENLFILFVLGSQWNKQMKNEIAASVSEKVKKKYGKSKIRKNLRWFFGNWIPIFFRLPNLLWINLT